MTDTIELPKEPLIDHVVALAREVGDYHDYTSPPDRGNERDVEWDWPDEWSVRVGEDQILLEGQTEGEYQVKTASATYNPPGAAHPAEYEWRTMPVAVTIHADLTEGTDLDMGEYTIEAHHA